jgi:DNA-binding response OmpR family regulator
MAGPSEVLIVLVVSQETREMFMFSEMLRSLDYVVHTAGTCAQSFDLLSKRQFALVVCEAALPDGNWTSVLTKLQTLDGPPRLIVASALADDRLWAEVLNHGGYDVLAKPFVTEEVARVVGLACTPPM